jgi:hypothetical protein
MAAEGEATEHEEPQQQEFGGTEAWDDPGGEPGDLSSLSAQTEWLNQQPMVCVFNLWSVWPVRNTAQKCARTSTAMHHRSTSADVAQQHKETIPSSRLRACCIG